MTTITSLHDAVAGLIHDGDTLALEGFTHLIPHAAGHEIIRQQRRDLTLIRMTPDIVYDQLIGTGAVRTLVFSWGGNPGVGSLHRFRDAVENRWPAPIALVEHTHATMAAAWAAGAADLPFGTLRASPATDTARHNPDLRTVTCPFTGETLTAVRAHRPHVTVIHAQRADTRGNVQIWGITGVQKEAALAARRVIVTVEEIVPRLSAVPGAIVLPASVITAVCEVRHGAWPSYTQDYSDRDHAFYQAWEAISRERASFQAWIDRHIRGTADHAAFLTAVRGDRFRSKH